MTPPTVEQLRKTKSKDQIIIWYDIQLKSTKAELKLVKRQLNTAYKRILELEMKQ